MELAADLVGRSVKRIRLGGSGCAGVSEDMRTRLPIRRPRHGDGTLGELGKALQRRFPVGLVFRDVHLTRDRHLHGIELLSTRFAFGAIERDAFTDDLGRRVLIENEVEAARRGTLDRRRASGCDPNRRMRALRGRRFDYNILELPETARMRKALT